MARKLPSQFMTYRNPKLLYVDAKTIDPERLLTSLFMRLDNQGRNVTLKRNSAVDKPRLLANIATVSQRGELIGFDSTAEASEVVWRWLESDLLITIALGKRAGNVAAARPLHLTSYRLRNAEQTRDYNTSEQLYTMIRFADPCRETPSNLEQELRNYLDADANEAALDVASLMVKRMAEPEYAPPTGVAPNEPPVLAKQAATMCDDLWRLLTYRDLMTRQTLIEMMRTILTMHIGLYVVRLVNSLPQWLQTGEIKSEVEVKLLTDLGEEARSPMAVLARSSYADFIANIPEYVRSTFAFNQLQGYWRVMYRTEPTAKDIIGLIASAFDEVPFKAHFTSDLYRFLLPSLVDEDNRADPLAAAIVQAEEHPFNQLVEVISYARMSFHHHYTLQLVNSTLMKNTDYGLIRSGLGRWSAAQPRFTIGSKLLETFILLALLEGEPGNFRTRPRTVEWFIDWLADRYGLYLNPIKAEITSGDAYPAYRANFEVLKERLRTIGYYSDLSDASGTQTIVPRYRNN